MARRRYTVNCSILLAGLPVLERPAAARRAGFDAVEFWWPFEKAVPADSEVDAFVRAVENAGVALTGLNFAAGDMAAGERGLVSDPSRSAEFRANVDVAVGIAERLGTRALNALYGNRVDGAGAGAQDQAGAESLALAGRAAARIGAVVLVEPVSGAPAYPLKRAGDAIAVMDRVRREHGVDALRLLADLYHLHVNGDDIPAVIDRYASRIGHVQIADAPGRGAPGTGSIDLDAHLTHLARSGYDGYVGLEFRATRTDPFDWLPRGLRGSSVTIS